MRVSDFDFHLPPELIAQEPPVERGTSRLLHLDRRTGVLAHRSIIDLPHLLDPGDVLVVNDTRVFPARLLGRRDPSWGAVECLLLTRLDEPDAAGAERWEALVHPGQKLKPGARLVFEGHVPLEGEVLERRFFGRRAVRLWTPDGSPVARAVDAIGHMPLPPYIKRPDRASDRERYQTVYAQSRGSIAAPTAGLHFTPGLLASLDRRGIERAAITLHVGYGTFQPIRVEMVEEHRMELEPFEISDAAARAINAALDAGRRIVAVGTTTTRALESVARANGGRIVAGRGATDLFIHPGFDFRVLSGLQTNFHLPQSSLLMLVSAFAGRERVLDAYREAVARGYRFYSYGDAMLML
ncbi:MAG TPA: tRNA preQ1(34) S-adenosylmethionine ribosyltransferase-isomerase QueA [Vicinamibacterales bacterium]|nr:tRNA preQ1(34) S-adenosylmethionine ribosyltransferase-isomerase QueA [Vicinamibacterales bacterium]